MVGVNSTESIITTDKPIIKEIKKWKGNLIDPNVTTMEKVDYGLKTMQTIKLIFIAVKDLVNIVLTQYVTAESIKNSFLWFYCSSYINIYHLNYLFVLVVIS